MPGAHRHVLRTEAGAEKVALVARRAPPSNRHFRQVMAQRHVFGEFLLRNSLLDLELSVFHAADIAIDNADVILLADELVALRMGQRIRHLHAFKRPDYAFDILARLVAGRLDRLFEGEDVLPGLPAMALVHDALAADLARVDVVDAEELVELLMKAVVLCLELTRKILEEINSLGRALDIVRRDGLDAGRGGIHLHLLL